MSVVINEYQVNARRTQNPDLSASERMQHAIYGMVSEVSEINDAHTREDQIKELGDLCWFISEYCDVCGWNVAGLVDSAVQKAKAYEKAELDCDDLIGCLFRHVGEVCGAYQKTFQGHGICLLDLERSVVFLLACVMEYARLLAVEDGIEGVMRANIEKLRRRYPVKFTAECSVNRVE